MVDYRREYAGGGGQQRRGNNIVVKSTATWSTDDHDVVDMDQLNDQMNSFPQDMLELSATKQNIKQFKDVSSISKTFSIDLI